MPEICEGVQFDKVAREWRFKWTPADDKTSLVEAQKVLATHLDELKKSDGVVRVQRMVCGECYDFRVIISVEEAKFAAYGEGQHPVEQKFLEAVKKVDGVVEVETQNLTIMDM